MKKLLSVLFISLILFASCADSKTFTLPNDEGKQESIKVEPYGLFNTNKKVNGIEYKVCVGNIVWDVILVETIIVPVWLIGWQFYEPVGLAPDYKIRIVDGVIIKEN